MQSIVCFDTTSCSRLLGLNLRTLLAKVNGVKTTDLGGELLGLLGSSSASKHGILRDSQCVFYNAGNSTGTYLAIEVLRNLLKGSVTGLDVEEVDDDELDDKPDVVDDVVLPLDVA